jgi:uncharacterized protein (TIGR04255 family)
MTLMFPHQPDVQLENAPLAEVICQVRFPPILRILSEEPSEFQERVRRRFPELQFEQGVILTMPTPPISGPPAVEAPPRVYRFHNRAEQTTVSLALDFFAVSTQAYTHWRNFAADLVLTADTVQAIYAPAYASRIGLRYVNRFTPATMGRQTMDEVLALLRPELSALYRTDAWSSPSGFVTQLTLPDDAGTLMIRSAFGHEGNEPYFLLDFDYFEEGQLDLAAIGARCDRYHRTIYNAFRWSLQPASLDVFRPMAATEELP